ncbi:hypothetical protein FSP39_023079 [Pinctada imbricata]|uniref:BTB domain-containing protein n=1 Tax=Pinctada imbricata TaxID=66713 RepID=A0AA88YFP3_PINIB|nr:hypothetical protein FSP39_023079 [Pinctada imbricata]
MASNDSLTTSVTTVHPGRTLGECLGKYLDEQTDTDVSFIVGEDKIEVKAHRMVLQCRSPVFSRMLSQTFHDGGDIEIKDTLVDNFKTLIRFLYTDQANLNEENAIPVLHLADKYDVPLLYDRCVKFLNNNIKIENACLIFASAKRYNSETLKIASLSFICLNKDCLRSDEFLNLCREDVMDISGNENLSCKEENLLESLCRWAEVRCNETGKETNDANKRQILGNLLFTVRFPLMDYDFLINTLSNSKLLTDLELKLVLQKRSKKETLLKESTGMKEVKSIEDSSEADDTDTEDTDEEKPRRQMINGAARKAIQPVNIMFESGSVILLTEEMQQEQSISFTVSEDSWFYGVIMYGPETKTRFGYELRLGSYNDNSKKYSEIVKVSSFMTPDEKSYTCALPLNAPFLLNGSQRYLCLIMVFSNPSCRFYRLKDQTSSSVTPNLRRPVFTNIHFGKPSLKSGQIVVLHSGSSVAEKESSSDQGTFTEKSFFHKILKVTKRSDHIAGMMIF